MDLGSIRTIIEVGSAITMAGAALKFARDSKRYTDAIKTIERVAPTVEGDQTNHDDEKKRDGLIGRMKNVETRLDKIETLLAGIQALIDAFKAEVAALTGKIWKRIRAILRGMGVPSDISDDVRVEREVKKRISEAHVKVDNLAANLALSDREPTGPHPVVHMPARHSPIERVPRPDPRRDYHPRDPRRDDTDPPPGSDPEE